MQDFTLANLKHGASKENKLRNPTIAKLAGMKGTESMMFKGNKQDLFGL